jgi:alpha-2-macroglobulin-like protein
MFYQITLLLWALFTCSAPGNVAETSDLSVSNTNVFSAFAAPQQAPVDSAVFREIKEKLDASRHTTAPEKLYLHLDRTLLRPGETIWFNAYLLNAGDLLPSIQSQMLQVELLNPRGAVIQSKKYLALHGVAAGEFDFPASLPGGLYKIRAYSNWMLNFNQVFEREITLQAVVLPKLNLKLEFERKGLGAGETAIARFDAQSLDNQPIAEQTIKFSAALAGNTFYSGEAKTDANGRAYLRFPLPDKLESADGLLNVQLGYGGQNEAISRPIPIVLNKIDLQFFPEGGNAVAGLPTRVAFKAVNEFGKPADVEGTIHDSQGQQVASFSSYHDGMGAFEFLPQGGRYEARLSKPYTAEKAFPLPMLERSGYILHLQERTATGLRFLIRGNEAGKVFLVGQVQDKLFFFKEIEMNGQDADQVEVPTQRLPMGIARFTLFDVHKAALAERLVFVNRDKGLKIDIVPDKEKYLPREKVKLNIRVADNDGTPVQGAFSLGVTDESLLTFADDKQGHLLSSLLLEQDVKGKIEAPNFYFDQKEEKSEQALDYLLMTQGWRRFEWKRVLSGYSPLFFYTAERAEITGQILGKNNRPECGKKVQLYPNGPSMMTDNEGYFSFANLPQWGYSRLQVSKDERFGIYGYGNFTIRRAEKTVEQTPKNIHFPTSKGKTYLAGKVIDDTGEALIGVSIRALQGKNITRGAISDLDGNYCISLEPGAYNLELNYTGFKYQRIGGVFAAAGKINHVKPVVMSNSKQQEMVITAYKAPLIEQDKTSGAQTLTSEQIRNLPTRSVNAIVATTAGTTSIEGADVNIKGSRDNATNYYIDGIRVGAPMEGANLAEIAIYSYSVPMISADDMSTGRTFSSQQLVPGSASFGQVAYWKREKAVYAFGQMYNFSQSRVFYSPKYAPNSKLQERRDFRPTIYWNPAVLTDKQGEASVEFYASDAVTNFRATLEGLSAAGQPGRCEKQFFVQKPVSVAMKLPASVITGDVLNMQITITNNMEYPAGGNLAIDVPAHFEPVSTLFSKGSESILVPAGETKTIAVPYKIGLQTKPDQSIGLKLSADEIMLDAFETSIRTLDSGFPVRLVMGGLGQHSTFDIDLLHPVENTVSATLTAYPNPLADVLTGMERMLHQPNGCFEQVSSINYPNLLVLDLLRQQNNTSPELESRAMGYLETGYEALIGYECKTGGFDWYGRDPGHEVLTAYGILQFTDMAKVFPVDPAMIARTVKWLASRRNGQGGWTLNKNNLHGWKNDPLLNCYIVWALAEAGHGHAFLPEIANAKENAVKSGDPYQLALMANTLLTMGDPKCRELLSLFVDKQQADGSWAGKSHSAMHGYGKCLSIETTALTALALMKTGNNSAALTKAMEYIFKAKTAYGFGSTQSTVLALKVLVQYAKNSAIEPKIGQFSVMVDGQNLGSFDYSTKSLEHVQVTGLAKYFKTHKPKIEVVFEGESAQIPFDLELKYASTLPLDAPECPLYLSTTLAQKKALVGETLRLSAILKNKTDRVQASPMLVLGIPSGASLQPWQLKKLVDEHKCDFYELWDGFAVFHFDRLLPNETRELNLDLRADISGVFDAPASQAFLYYSNDQRVWSKVERVEIGRQAGD